eukprot:SAG22_NODE_1386_length_4531_cov_153.363499_2_plen_1117_part_00
MWEGTWEVDGGQLLARRAIVKGHTTTVGALSVDGGGHAIVVGCMFLNNVNELNYTADGTTGGGRGGAIMATAGATIEIHDCIFENNTGAIAGGAISLSDGADAFTRNITFRENAAGVRGGAISMTNGSALRIQSSTFDDNGIFEQLNAYSSGRRRLAGGEEDAVDYVPSTEYTFANFGVGGAVYIDAARLAMEYCVIKGSRASIAGGAVWLTESAANVSYTTMVENFVAVNVSYNESLVPNDLFNGTTFSAGGAIYAERADLRLDQCVLRNNTAGSGPSMYLLDLPQTWLAKDTVMEPYDSHGSVFSVRVPKSGCNEDVCPVGYSCRYLNYSTFCTRCFDTLYSDDGLTCKGQAATQGSNCNDYNNWVNPLTPVECPWHKSYGGEGSANQSSPRPCEPHQYSYFGACLACPPGTQVNSSTHQSCALCEEGKYSDDGLGCKTCPPAYEPNEPEQLAGATSCMHCPVAKFSETGFKCIVCPKDSNGFAYEPIPNRTACVRVADCREHELAGNAAYSTDGGVTCEDCPGGRAIFPNKTGCSVCVGNEYSPVGVSCEPCPAGTQPNENRTDCHSCAIVSIAAYSDDGVECLSCPHGTQPAWNRSTCLNCSDLEVWGFGVCTRCTSGKQPRGSAGFRVSGSALENVNGEYREIEVDTDVEVAYENVNGVLMFWSSNSNGQWIIATTLTYGFLAVSAGNHSLAAGPTGPIVFRDNTSHHQTDNTWQIWNSSWLPDPGLAVERVIVSAERNVNHRDCVDCPPAFVGLDGECHRCPSSTEPVDVRTPGVPKTECLWCPSGYAGVHGDCAHCLPGQQPNTNRTACEQCIAQEYSPVGEECMRCSPGYEVSPDQSACDICEEGWYSDDGYKCKECTVGYEVNAPLGATGCDSCVLASNGHVSSDGKECRLCIAGTTPDVSRADCQPCFSYHAGPPGNCTRCPSGTEPAPDRATCIRCEGGNHGTDGFCEACSDGYEPITKAEEQRLYAEIDLLQEAMLLAAHAGAFGELSQLGDQVQNNQQRLRELRPSGCVPCPEGFAGAGGVCEQCYPGEQPNPHAACYDANLTQSKPQLKSEQACLRAGGVCSDPTLGTREDCLLLGSCCTVGTTNDGTTATDVLVVERCVNR